MIIYTGAGFMCLFIGIFTFLVMPDSIWNSEVIHYRTAYFLLTTGLGFFLAGLYFDKKQKEYLANPELYTNSTATFKIPWHVSSTFFFIPVTWLGVGFLILFIYCLLFKEIPLIGNF
ncbi:MAG: hypothetical protein ACJAT4_003054 [Granulosicoccus sp.]|jgi:hypothetical protein